MLRTPLLVLTLACLLPLVAPAALAAPIDVSTRTEPTPIEVASSIIVVRSG